MGLGNSFVDMLRAAATPPKRPTAEEKARDEAARATAANIGAQAESATQRPACLDDAHHAAAVALCAQKRIVGHEAVAAFGRALGASDPLAAAMALAPCEWAEIPKCPPNMTTSSSFVKASPGSSTTASLNRKAVPLPQPAAPAPAPKSDAPLIIGGVLAGAVLLGLVFYKLKDHGA